MLKYLRTLKQEFDVDDGDEDEDDWDVYETEHIRVDIME